MRSLYWPRNEAVREQLKLREKARQWDAYARNYPGDLPTPDVYKDVDIYGPEPQFHGATIHELVADHVIPLTKALRAPLYARVPPADRGKPQVFLSHAWANSVVSPVEHWRGGTLDAFNSEGIAGIKEEFVWIDFVCYNQHSIPDAAIAFDMEAVIQSIGNVAFAVTTTPLFDRLWCLWEVLSVSKTEARTQFCVGPGYRTDKRMMVNNFFESFRSIEQAGATKTDDREKLLAAMIAKFGSVAATDEYVRQLMREGMEHGWFELSA